MPREILTAVVLVPCDRVVKEGRGEHIHIAISIHVGSKHGSGGISHGSNNIGREVLATIVFVPRDRVVSKGCGKHIQIAVAVDIRCEHRTWSVDVID
jgi:hypothetical protein